MITYVKRDLLDSNCDFICHQVNCQGVMNSGIAKQIREKWPEVYTQYLKKYVNADGYSDKLLGEIQHVPVSNLKTVINMFAQENYGYDGHRYTSYDAFWNCLNLIKQTVPKGKTIGFPKKIGCDRGGANWPVILEMITEVLGVEYKVFIYYLEGDDGTY